MYSYRVWRLEVKYENKKKKKNKKQNPVRHGNNKESGEWLATMRAVPVRSPSVIYLLLGVVINVACLGFYYFGVYV